VSKSIV